jgi:hypothetical protein
MTFFKLLKATQEEIEALTKRRKTIYWLGVGVLLVIAVFVPERYAVLCFLGAIITTLFEISRKLLDIYFIIQLKADVIITMLPGIASEKS